MWERGHSIKPIKKEVQFIGPVQTALQPHATSRMEPGNGFHATPHIPHVVSPEFILQFTPVIVFSLPDVKFEYPLYSPHLIMVALSERSFLFIKDGLNVLSDPRFIISITGNSPSRDIAVHAEVYVVRDALCEPINVLPVGFTECRPVSYFKAALQCLMSLLRPPPHSPCGRRLPLHQRHIAGFEVNQVVI